MATLLFIIQTFIAKNLNINEVNRKPLIDTSGPEFLYFCSINIEQLQNRVSQK